MQKNKFITLTENGRKNTYYFGKNGKAIKGLKCYHQRKKILFLRGTGAGAGVRAQNVSLTSADGLVSVFNKNGVCTKQYRLDEQ